MVSTGNSQQSRIFVINEDIDKVFEMLSKVRKKERFN